MYELRYTGKTTLMYQALADMTDREIAEAAFITAGRGITMTDLRMDLGRLRDEGKRTFFIDEVTRVAGFIDGSYYFADVLAATGCRVVLCGTDSLGFHFASSGDLYGKTVTIHTTYIPFREHRRLIGPGGIDDYIRYGGVLKEGWLDVDDPSAFVDIMPFGDGDRTGALPAGRFGTQFVTHVTHTYGLYRFHVVLASMRPVSPDTMAEEARELELRISELPIGYISRKTINGKVRLYHQWYEGGKVRGRYLKEGEADLLASQIETRKELQSRLRALRESMEEQKMVESSSAYCNMVLMGDSLVSWASVAEGWEKRGCYRALDRYLKGRSERVCVLYGLRRTGKTTLMRQAILDMGPEELSRTAYVMVSEERSMFDLNRDIKRLREAGVRVLFIDEVTLMRDFISGSALLSDIYVPMGMRIVLSGTDSLGFWFAEDDRLYDRVVTIHTTYIPFREHRRLLRTEDVDKYIEYGGTLSIGQLFLDTGELEADTQEFMDSAHVRRYSDRAIALNIQNSLARAEAGRKLMPLQNLYESGELTNAINRVVEDINHRFVLSVVESEYTSRNLDDARDNLMAEGEDLLGEIDREAVLEGLRRRLSILEKGDQRIGMTAGQVEWIKRYLMMLDLTDVYPVVTPETGIGEGVLITQPGMRYVQAKELVDELKSDHMFAVATSQRQDAVAKRVLDTVKGRMLEEVVIHDTIRLVGPGYDVFKLMMADHEVDMVVCHRESGRCLLFEIKHASSRNPRQYRHLVHPSVEGYLEGTRGHVAGRFVLYNGEPCEDGVRYLNVSDFLSGLPESVGDLLEAPGQA